MEKSDVHADLDIFKGDRPKLMQHYGEQLQGILKEYGGNISDIPLDPSHRYHKIQDKIRYLGSLSQAELNASRLDPDALEKRKRDAKEKK